MSKAGILSATNSSEHDAADGDNPPAAEHLQARRQNDAVQAGEQPERQHCGVDVQSGGEAGRDDESRDVAGGEDGHAETPSRPK